MAARRLRAMMPADLALLPEPYAACAFAEGSPAERTPAAEGACAARRLAWAREVAETWGCCGALAVHEEQVIGFVTVAPARSARRVPALANVPDGADVAVLLSAQVVEEWRGKGIGRQLVSTTAGLLARRDVRALEAVGTRLEEAACLLPVGWLESVGFAVVREHPSTPRLRMDLQSAQRWPGLGAAWNRLTGLVTPPVAPQPASYARRDADPVAAPRPLVRTSGA